jgi:hypothetical protein
MRKQVNYGEISVGTSNYHLAESHHTPFHKLLDRMLSVLGQIFDWETGCHFQIGDFLSLRLKIVCGIISLFLPKLLHIRKAYSTLTWARYLTQLRKNIPVHVSDKISIRNASKAAIADTRDGCKYPVIFTYEVGNVYDLAIGPKQRQRQIGQRQNYIC